MNQITGLIQEQLLLLRINIPSYRIVNDTKKENKIIKNIQKRIEY